MQKTNLTFTWRVEQSVRDWLKKQAQLHGRSMNAQLSEIVNQAKEQAKEKTA